ncbi:hypothetical protein SAY86_021614 [Trapa natans]|uniref:Uncharacterized protein n=1 Tax=Trapa natans TaxID=22666 RepID=A0AAN7MKR0_TRANT|nr:hypothetical protein SAY86_021614 [Trapa natans]
MQQKLRQGTSAREEDRGKERRVKSDMGLCSSKKLQAGALSPQKLRVRKPPGDIPGDKSAQGMPSPPVKLLIQDHHVKYWDLVWSVPGSKGIFDVYEAFLLSRPAIFSALRKSYLLFPLFSFSLSSQNILLLQ